MITRAAKFLLLILFLSGVMLAQTSFKNIAYVQTYQGFGQQPLNWPWSSLDEVVLFHCYADNSALGFNTYNGSPPNGLLSDSYMTTLMNKAATYSPAKLIIVSFQPANQSFYHSTMAKGNAYVRNTLVHNWSNWAKKFHVAGVSFDNEGISVGAGTTIGSDGSQAQWDSLFQAFRDTLNTWSPRGLLTEYVMQGGGRPSTSPVAQAVFDQVFVNGYDFNYTPGYGIVGMSDLRDPGSCPITSLHENDSTSISIYLNAGFNPSKLFVGMPYYGRSWTTTKLDAGFCDQFTAVQQNYVLYDEIVNSRFTTPGVVKKWNPVSATNILVTTTGTARWAMEFPDANSIGQRVRFAINHNLGGVYNYDLAWGHLNTVPAGHTADELQQWAAQAASGIPSDLVPPTVTITDPAPGDTVSGTSVITVNAADNVGVVRVDFLVDGNVVGSSYNPPFSYSWTTSKLINGGHALTAWAYDGAGNSRASSAVNIFIRNTPSLTTNIALNKSTQASSVQSASYPTSYAVDGNASTRWSSVYSDPQWIQVDLGAAYRIDSIALSWDPAYAVAYKLQTSLDGSAWTDIYSTSAGDGGWDNIKITPVSARYVRMNGTSRATQWGYSLWSFEVYQAAPTNMPRIKGELFFDRNGNGVKDLTEPGMPGWTIRLQGPMPMTTVTDSAGFYSFESLPYGSYYITQTILENWSQSLPSLPGGYSFSIASDTADLTADFGDYAANVVPVSFEKGWNIISLPVGLEDTRILSVYPLARSNAFTFRNAYVIADSMDPGVGYWTRFDFAQTFYCAGSQILQDTVDIDSSWNLIGSISVPMAASAITSIPPDIIMTSIYGYNRVFIEADSIVPGRGYWVKASQAGKIVFSQSAVQSLGKNVPALPLNQLNSLTFTNREGDAQTLYFGSSGNDSRNLSRYLLPPPMSGLFDVRFSSGSGTDGQLVRLTDAANPHAESLPIRLRSVDYPLRIRWKMRDPSLRARLEINRGESYVLEGESEIVVTGSGASDESQADLQMDVHISTENRSDLPSAVTLYQNYPNPFNPTTNFRFDLPSDSRVVLVVFNILGERVATVLDKDMRGGSYTVPFDGSRLSSGVYMCQLRVLNPASGIVTKIQRIALIK